MRPPGCPRATAATPLVDAAALPDVAVDLPPRLPVQAFVVTLRAPGAHLPEQEPLMLSLEMGPTPRILASRQGMAGVAGAEVVDGRWRMQGLLAAGEGSPQIGCRARFDIQTLEVTVRDTYLSGHALITSRTPQGYHIQHDHELSGGRDDG